MFFVCSFFLVVIFLASKNERTNELGYTREARKQANKHPLRLFVLLTFISISIQQSYKQLHTISFFHSLSLFSSLFFASDVFFPKKRKIIREPLLFHVLKYYFLEIKSLKNSKFYSTRSYLFYN